MRKTWGKDPFASSGNSFKGTPIAGKDIDEKQYEY
jgi:hypothetical protein